MPLTSSIEKLASSQTSVVSYLVKLNRAIQGNHRDLVLALTNRLCDELIDYISYTHYRVLRRRTIPDHQYAAIERITQEVLAFNDRYGTTLEIDFAGLKADLESLALALETRFEIEDEVAAEVALA